MNFQRPSKIQSVSLPMILTPPFKNLVAQSHRGAGKTTGIVLGMLSRVDPTLAAPQALCVCSTRVCGVSAIRNMEVLRRMGRLTGITSEFAIPGDSTTLIHVRKSPAISAQVLIGTPGTISNLVGSKKLSLDSMKLVVVFDEADEILAETGFRVESKWLMRGITASCQVLLFAATVSEAVEDFVVQTFGEDYNQMFANANV